MNRNIHQQITDNAFNDYAETIWIYLKSSNSKGSNFDPFLNVGYTTTNQNPEPVKAIIHQISGSGLIYKELGLVNTGTLEVIVKTTDVNLFKIAQKIIYDEIEYTPFNKATGNRVQIFKRPFGFSRIILFVKGN